MEPLEAEFSELLNLLSSRPRDQQASELEATLKAGIAGYQKLLKELDQAIKNYRKAARKINGLD